MKFVWVPSINRFRRTETEVKKERLAYEVVEFETDKDSLIDRFNRYEERIEELQNQIGGSAPAVAPEQEPSVSQAELPATVAVQSAPVRPQTDEAELRRRLAQQIRGMEADEICEKIGESKGHIFANYLSAAISRLGELREDGWSAFVNGKIGPKDIKGAPMYNSAHERGLRFLTLAQIRNLDSGEETA